MTPVIRILKPLASAAIFYYATLWLVALVTVGTITQKYFGLQYSLEKYFSSWFLQPMDMPVYLPGGRLTMAIILVSLTAKILVSTKWKFKALGINITHLGVLCLLLGGVITAYTTTEGSMRLAEGSESDIFQDFHEVEIAVADTSPADHNDVTTFTQGFFNKGETFTHDKVPVTFEVLKFYKNANITSRPKSEKSNNLRGPAIQAALEELPTDKKDRNVAGIEVEISGIDDKHNGTYIFLAHPNWKPAIVEANGITYNISLRNRHHKLPFSIYLNDFEKLDHAGTNMARAYSSRVKVTQGKSSDSTKIYMNHPLRRNGYTLYQSSFVQQNIEESIFQVVHNKGQWIPYISIFIIFAGLLIHVVMQIPRLIVAAKTKKQPAASA